MIEMIVDRVQVSLMSQHRLVVLRDIHEDLYLPIWIGQFESEAITLELQEVERERPLTHDLLKSTITSRWVAKYATFSSTILARMSFSL